MPKIDKNVYASGIRFECTSCGECCKARGGYDYVYVTLVERRRLARHLKLNTTAFTKTYCAKANGQFHLRDPQNDCLFLNGVRCTVYAARPQQCRTWPFWPANMKRRVWEEEVKPGCPGIGVGRLHTPGEIEAVLKKEQQRERETFVQLLGLSR